ncbi:MAG: hypothetical protein HC828_13460, partial [Blastochloris sp.]|nr:hypothetical protein [Blastochloris sp.]
AGRDFGLVAVDLGNAGLVAVIGEASYAPGSYDTINFIDLPSRPTSIAVSPNSEWAVVTGIDDYWVIEMASAFEVNYVGTPFDGVAHAAISNDRVFVAQDNAEC